MLVRDKIHLMEDFFKERFIQSHIIILLFIFPSMMMVMNSLCLSICSFRFIFLYFILFIIVPLSLTSTNITSFVLCFIQLFPIISFISTFHYLKSTTLILSYQTCFMLKCKNVKIYFLKLFLDVY